MKIIDDIQKINILIKSNDLENVFNQNRNGIQIRIYDKDEFIMKKGMKSDYLYFLIKGNLKVDPISIHNKVAMVDYIKPIDVLGEFEFFSNKETIQSIYAITKVTILAISYSELNHAYTNNVDFYKFLSYLLAQKLEHSSSRYSESILHPLKYRIASFLIHESKYADNVEISINISKTAESFGCDVRHFRRILQEFENEGFIKRNQKAKTVIILKPKSFEKALDSYQ